MIDRLNAALEGRYRIDEELGQGGMATVFLAEDVKHKRQVAVKVLKPELAAVVGADRFLAEIETTANLQHPHILPLYDSGEADSFLFYVMPYVEGESLGERLGREQQLPVDEALRITKAIAGALDYAHRQGVVHRDIKPANILMHEGEPMVADFGIALAVSQAGDGRITETGLSLGTPHYMSPEQAAGERSLDRRSDVYALGCVLYEMLTGQPPFGGPNAQAVLGRILTGEPDAITSIRRSVPANVEAAVHKALERLPADRFDSAEAFVRALDDPGFTTTVGTVTRGGAVVGERWRRRFGAAAAVALIAVLVAALAWLRPAGERPEPIGFTLPFDFPAGNLVIAMSPDGRRIALGDIATGIVTIREMDTVEPRPLGVQGSGPPGFSPDGSAVLVTGADQEVRVVPLGGGPARTIGQAAQYAPTVWGEDGYAYMTTPDFALARIPITGGPVDTLLVPEGDRAGYAPQVLLPGGRGLVYVEFRVEPAASFRILDLESGESTHLAVAPLSSFLTAAYTETGHVLFPSDRFLMAQPLDLGSLETTGPAVPVAEVPSGIMRFAYGGGTLVYVAGEQAGALVPRITDREGRDRGLPGLDGGGFDFPEVSPTGDRIAMQVTGQGSEPDIFVYEMPDGPLTRLSLEGGANTTTWTRDGEYLLYLRQGDAYRARSDGSDEPELILDLEQQMTRVTLTPDEDRLLYQVGRQSWDIGVYTLGEEGSDSLILGGDYPEGHPAVSPDGRWLAYYSGESGSGLEVFIRPLSGPGRKHQVSRQGGLRPRWSSDGSELFFAGDPTAGSSGIWVATIVDDGDDKDVTDVRRLFDMPTYNYDVFPGDSLFVTLRVPDLGGDATASEATVIAHFDRILEERVRR